MLGKFSKQTIKLIIQALKIKRVYYFSKKIYNLTPLPLRIKSKIAESIFNIDQSLRKVSLVNSNHGLKKRENNKSKNKEDLIAMENMSFIDKSDIPAYYKRALYDLLSRVKSLKGLNVLEIGGSSLPKEIIKRLEVNKWVSVDIQDHDSGNYQSRDNSLIFNGSIHDALPDNIPNKQYVIIDGDATALPSAFDGLFDVVFSVNTFEHVSDLISLSFRIKNLLIESGLLYTEFGPIWSGPYGSHFWGSEDWDFAKPGPVDQFDHLLMRPSELFNKVTNSGINSKIAAYGIYEMYTSSKINRLFASDYKKIFSAAGYSKLVCKPGHQFKIDKSLQNLLEEQYPFNNDFNSYTLIIEAEK